MLLSKGWASERDRGRATKDVTKDSAEEMIKGEGESGKGRMKNGAPGGGERHRLMQPPSDTSLSGRS